MTSTTTPISSPASLSARPLRCRNCGAEHAAAPVSICEQCLGPLDPRYEPGRRMPDRKAIAARAPSLWRYREWLPFDGDPVLSLDTGFTPLADRFGWGIVNVNLRGYYGEGSKTVAYEIMEQLGWRLPTAVVAPMAGGSLVTKLRKGFGEFQDAGLVHGVLPRLYGAQPSGCAPIVRLVERGGTRIEPEVPDTICRSLAIGNPADGPFAARALLESGGWAAAVSDAELVQAIRFLAEDSGVFAETAGGVTAAAALALARAGRLRPDDEVVLCITGHGLKTVEAVTGVLPEAPVIAPRLREVAGLVERSS